MVEAKRAVRCLRHLMVTEQIIISVIYASPHPQAP